MAGVGLGFLVMLTTENNVSTHMARGGLICQVIGASGLKMMKTMYVLKQATRLTDAD
jgi:hypothetical protein